MKFKTYQEKAARTIPQNWNDTERTTHALLEMCSECGEVLGLFQKAMQGAELSMEELKLEIGDLLWGMSELCSSFHIDLNEVAKLNLQKLEKRYPNGFEAERIVNREKYETEQEGKE